MDENDRIELTETTARSKATQNASIDLNKGRTRRTSWSEQ